VNDSGVVGIRMLEQMVSLQEVLIPGSTLCEYDSHAS